MRRRSNRRMFTGMSTRIQTEHLNVKLPAGFDPAKHENQLIKLVSDRHGPGWEIDHIDPTAGTASVSRQASIAEVTETRADEQKNVRLPKTTKPADGDKMATKFEAQYDGFYLTAFEPYLGWATLTKLNDETARARGAIAVALGVKPWEIQIQQTADGGFEFTLPKGFVPSKHETKLHEVAEGVVGKEGWYVETNPQLLTAKIIPANPPTFPGTIPYPFNQKVPKFDPNGDWGKIPIGRKLGQGESLGDQLSIDLAATAHGQIAGISGGGKTVAINGFIYGLLARNFDLAVVDVKHKSVDFEWARPLVRPGGWGCESIAAGVTAVSLVIEEGERRAKLIKEHGVQKWTELPRSLNIKPIAVIFDEVTALFMMEEVPKGLPKEHALVVDALQKNLEKAVLRKLASRVAAEWRFAGISIFLATQMAQNNTGIPPTIKINLGNRLLFGANPNDAARGHAFQDPRSVPKVPRNIQVDSKANRGVGAAELEGQGEPSVFKAYYATTDDYRRHLDALGVPTTNRPEPTSSEIAKHSPSLEDGLDTPPSRLPEETGGYGRNEKPQRREDGLMGAAAAAHDMKVAEQLAAKQARDAG